MKTEILRKVFSTHSINYLIILVKKDLGYLEEYAKYISLTVGESFNALISKLHLKKKKKRWNCNASFETENL